MGEFLRNRAFVFQIEPFGLDRSGFNRFRKRNVEMKHEIRVCDEYRQPRVVIHSSHAPTPEAGFALQLVEKWGMILGEPSKEDSSGRMQYVAMAPAAVVKRAFDTAQLAYAEAVARGLMVEVPEWETMRDLAREEGRRN